MTMKNIVCSIVCLLMSAVAAFAAADNKDANKVTVFAEATLYGGDRDVYEGDSVVVQIALYSDHSFVRVESADKGKIEIKNAGVRSIGTGGRLTQQVVTRKGNRYFGVVVDQFVVRPDKTGQYTFPVRKYLAEMALQSRSRYFDPFEDFFGVDSPFRKHGDDTVKKECSSAILKINVVKRPPKTVEQLRQSGVEVM